MSAPLRSASIRAAIFGAALALTAVPAAGKLKVRFIHPERFTDARLNASYGADARVLRLIEQHLQDLADRCLDPDQELAIQVLDIDLAGRQEWWAYSGARDLRVMREITWPRIEITYSLRRNKDDVVEAKERISDVNYLLNSSSARSDSMPLPYERAMLTKWFERRFCR